MRSNTKIKESLPRSAWFFTVMLCFFLTAGSVTPSVSTLTAQAEEIALETAEAESSEKFHQARRTQKTSARRTHQPPSSVRRDAAIVAVVNNFGHRTERCRMNGFGGYLRS